MTALLALAAAPLVLTLVVLGFRRPVALILPAYAATVPFGSALPTGLPAPYGSLSSVLGLLLLVALAGQVMSGRASQARFPATVAVWLLFLGVAGASAFWSVSPQLTEAGFINLASLVVLYALLAFLPAQTRDLRRLELALVIGGVAASVYGLAQLLVLGGLPTGTDGHSGPRFGRELLGPNNTAAALLLPLAISLCHSVDWPRLLGRALHAVAAALLVTGVLLTGSRGGLVAVAACIVVAILVVPRGRALLVGYTAAALVMVAVVLVANPAGIGSRQSEQTDSSGRAEIWLIGLSACEHYCVTGAGWGTFPRVYQLEQPRVPEARVLSRGTNYEPHNIWILIGVEAGIAGLVLAAVGLTLTMRDSLRLPARLRGPPVVALTGTLVAGFFLSNFEYKFFWMTLMYALLCRTVALNSALPEIRTTPARVRVPA
ncbi:MAG: O-antigen ligase family protein [Actinomycetes bacterium]